MRRKDSVKNNRPIVNRLQALTSSLVTRARLSSFLGQSFDGDRKIYEQAGYPVNITYREFWGKYQRQDVAKRVVNAFPDATWRGKPEILENEEEEKTVFEKAWSDLATNLKIFHFLRRADRVAGIGRYGVLLLGLDDGLEFSQPTIAARQLLYVMPYSEDTASIDTFVKDKNNSRFALPDFYRISVSAFSFENLRGFLNDRFDARTERVHQSRVVHIADDTLESDVFGLPRLEAVYNRLQDIELVMAGGTESFWRGGYPGYAFEADAEADLDQTSGQLDDEIQKYVHGLQRYMKLQGITVNDLAQQIADPSKHVETELKLISAATGIPLRILTGSERGELASSKDQDNWHERIDERRRDFAEPMILRPLIDRLIELGVLPEPKDGYIVKWPDIGALDEKEKTEIAERKSKALGTYVSAIGATEIVPPFQFLTKFLGFTNEEAEAIIDEGMQMMEEDLEGAEE